MARSLAEPESPARGNASLPSQARLPIWLKKTLSLTARYASVSSCIAANGLHTVCTEARCPNRPECFSAGTASFLIMGNVCTRTCGFCGVGHGAPAALDESEPARVADAARNLGLRFIVITSVTRDDLPDGGAAHFARTIRACKEALPASLVETLIPDFGGSRDAVEVVLAAGPNVLNHNLETVPRLYAAVRPQADYDRSLDLLAFCGRKGVTTKSGIMVGLGETEEEVSNVLKDLRTAGCRRVTIGQYLPPSSRHLPAACYEPPEQFARYETLGRSLGYESVFAGPFVRSSYHAGSFHWSAG